MVGVTGGTAKKVGTKKVVKEGGEGKGGGEGAEENDKRGRWEKETGTGVR